MAKDKNVPNIDFNKYTFMVGQLKKETPGYVFDNQRVDIGLNSISLNVTLTRLSVVNPLVMTYFYFWGLYDKLPDLPVVLSVQETS
ncbi:MAG: hypothetical protein SPJ03_02280 [Candidatus Cryptobacteroides sp.]|nr:hypothetical protein [Candidatus Cryptobacteroides sp.]